MSQHFQVTVIGTGPGGYIAALKAAQLGAKVAVIEKKSVVGGTCLNWGCIPSKALLASAELVHHLKDSKKMGVEINGDITINWPTMQKRKDQVLNALRGGIKGLFKGREITFFQGTAQLNGPGKIHIEGNEGAPSHDITSDNIILGTGSEPFRLPGWPTDPELVCTSDEALHWKELPKSVLIVGGGVIGCEFAMMMQPLGVEVTIVELMPNLLGFMDSHLSAELLKIMKRRKINILTGVKVEDMQTTGNGIKATLDNGKTIEAEKCLVSIGRRPNTQGIGLETVGITPNQRGFIDVNDSMETGAKGIYCIGDANGRCLLAHAASAHGEVAAYNAMGKAKSFDAPIPSCVYTYPEIASVGITQEEARNQKLPISIGAFPLGHLGKAMAANDTDGFVKVIRHRETDQILGVHMLGHNVTEMIASASVLVHSKATAHDIVDMVFAHPTMSEGFREATEDALGAALHLPPRKVLRVSVGG